MPEPTLAALIAQSAAKAVGGMAVRASAPAWKAAFEKVRPAPGAVRRASSWSEVKLAKAQQDAITKYLTGRLCAGLLEILAFLELSEESEQRAEEKLELAASFQRELAQKLDLPADRAAELAGAMWADLHDCVRLQVVQLRELGAFAEEDLVNVARLAQWPPEPTDGRPMVRAVADRSAVSANYQRVLRAHGAIRMIRHAMRDRYSKLVMPHSREDYRVPIDRIYVTRTLSPIEDRTEFALRDDGVLDAIEEPAEVVPVPEDELDDRRFVVVGNPGAGKSTFIRHLIYRLATHEDDRGPQAPLVVELRDHQAPQHSYLAALTDRLRFITQAELDADTVQDILLLGLATVVFDGLDEISDLDHRRSTVNAIHAFCQRYPLVRVVVTAREEGYVAARLDPYTFPVYYLPDFTEDQVELYVQRWFRLVAVPRMLEPEQRVAGFLADSVHVGDLRTNPLMLSLLCMLYEYEGYIPENRPQVYEDCAELLFERWDRVRRVPLSFKSNSQTRYLVQELAYYFFNRVESQGGETEQKLRVVVKDYFEHNIIGGAEAAETQAKDFLDYCAGRAWLLTQIGSSDRGERLFDFTHRTFMEYFAACYIVRHCNNAGDLIDRIRPLILRGASEVVPQIAIQQFDERRARGVDACMNLLVFDQPDQLDYGFPSLRFALRTLRFVRPSPATVERLYTQALLAFGQTLDPGLLALLIEVPAETHDLLRRCCAAARTGVPARETESKALRLGAIIVTALMGKRHPDSVPAATLRVVLASRDIPRIVAPFRAELAELVRSAPDVAEEMFRRGLISARDFADLVGHRALVSMPRVHDGAIEGEQPGPLVEQLGTLLSTGFEPPDLRAMLELVGEQVDGVVPLDRQVTDALLNIAARLRADITQRLFPLPEPHAVGFYRLFLAVLCAAADLGEDAQLVVMGLPELRKTFGLRSVLPDREEIGPGLIALLDQTGPAPGWREVLESWVRGELKIGIGEK